MTDFFKNNPMSLRHCFLYEYLRKNKSNRAFRPKQKKIRFDLFKSNPMALRHCILFEVLQGTPIKEVYSKICSEIGGNLITYQNFKILFNQFSQEKLDDKEAEKPIVETLRNDKYALRVCILYKSFKYRTEEFQFSVFTVFEKFCEVIGQNVMEYREFEFWFYRFLNGEYDLNYERDKDKKVYELMDMPIDVMENIVKYLNIVDRFNLVQTSRSLQTFVEDQKLFQKTLKLSLSRYNSGFTFGESVNIHYMQSYRCVRGCTPEQALQYFKSIIKNPKLHLDNLEIDLDIGYSHLYPFPSLENAINDLKDALKFNHYLKVKKLNLYESSWDQLSKILPSLKPGYLRTIEIISTNPNVDSMKKVFEMEQWKQAKCFDMDGDCFIWPLHHLYHFEEFFVSLLELSVEDIREMKEILFKSTNFKKGSFMMYRINDAHAIGQEFGVFIREDIYSRIYHYPIPNSTEYFEITIDEEAIDINRKK